MRPRDIDTTSNQNKIKFRYLTAKGRRFALPFAVLILLTACGGFAPGGPGSPNGPLAGGPVGGLGQSGATGNPGGQPTQDGIIREGPGAMLVSVSFDPRTVNAADLDDMVLSADVGDSAPPSGGNPTGNGAKGNWAGTFYDGLPSAELKEVPPIQVMIQHLMPMGSGYFSVFNYEENYRAFTNDRGAVIPVYHTPTSKTSACNENFKVWACTIQDGKYYESEAVVRACPYGTYDRPYGLLPLQEKTHLILHEAPAKSCPNPQPEGTELFVPPDMQGQALDRAG